MLPLRTQSRWVCNSFLLLDGGKWYIGILSLLAAGDGERPPSNQARFFMFLPPPLHCCSNNAVVDATPNTPPYLFCFSFYLWPMLYRFKCNTVRYATPSARLRFFVRPTFYLCVFSFVFTVRSIADGKVMLTCDVSVSKT